MKIHRIIIVGICFLFVCLYGQAQTGIKGIVTNMETEKDSIALYNPFDRQNPVLEKVMIGKKGTFEFTYTPSEIGFYFIVLSNKKNVLVVLTPQNNGQVEINASTGILSKITNSEQNTLLKSAQEIMANYNEKQQSVEQSSEKSAAQKQLDIQILEVDKLDAIANLLLKNTSNYASAALIEYLPTEKYLAVHDSILTALLKKYSN
ncbi:MAG: DUF4369 domain-containing protein, partial [Bacteroidales bacterium]|nr:DUF4369 domain-containing protein [Bacteroidales bacterium]